MKRIMLRLTAALLFAATVITPAAAQYSRGHRYQGVVRTPRASAADRVYRGLRTAQTVAGTAYMLRGLGATSTYTGLRLGYNAATLRLSGDIDADADATAMGGVSVGVVFGWQIGRSPIFFEPGLYYSGKGATLKADYGGSRSNLAVPGTKFKYRMHMLEVPFVFKYGLPIDKDIAVEPFFGGFIAFGLGGDAKDYTQHETYDTFADDGFKNFDAGLRFGLGLEVSHFYMEAAYDLGLCNLPESGYADVLYNDFDDKIRSGCVSLSIGFNF